MSLLHDSGGSGMSAQLAKRKRGRPRKDSSLKQAHTPGSEGGRTYLSQRDNRTECMVGKAVTGFIEAAFDSGFLLSVRIGNSNIHLRGVVFKPGHCVPITAENDVAPHAQMIRRSDVRFTFENQGKSPGPATSGVRVVRSKRKHAPLKAPAAPQASDHGDADVHMAEPLSMLPPGRSIPAGQVFVAMQPHPSCQGSQRSNDGLSNKGTSEVVQTENPAPTHAKTVDAKESLKSSAGSSEQETKDSNEPFPNEFSFREPMLDYGVAWMTELLKAQENSQERQVQVAEHPTSASQVEFHGTATGELVPTNQASVHDTSVPDPVISLAAVGPSNPRLERFGRIVD